MEKWLDDARIVLLSILSMLSKSESKKQGNTGPGTAGKLLLIATDRPGVKINVFWVA